MSRTALAETIFWLSGALLFHTFLGYGAWTIWRARRWPRPLSHPAPGTPLPEVCVVVVAHNEGSRIAARLENLLASEYPREKLRVLLISDGSTDDTVARAEALRDPRVEILALPERQGKAAGLNAALAHTTAGIIVLTDARQRFAPDAIARLTAHFADPQIGAVSGALEIDAARSAAGSGVDTYWRYEKLLRAAESRVDSCIGCTGAIYAIRPALYSPIPTDTLLDDVIIPMQIAARGARVIHDPAALAFDPQTLEPTSEQRRKARTLAGNFQMLFRHPGWLLPWRHRLWWALLSHKYLRLAAPVFLFAAFASNLALTVAPFYQITLATQLLFYSAAALGALPGGSRLRVLALPAGFVFLNAMTLRGLHHYLTHTGRTGWNQGPDAVPARH